MSFRFDRITALVGSFLLVGFLVQLEASAQQKNSTRKIRVKPNAQSQKIGTAVKWQPSFEDAVKQSKATGKPIFWYVPTISGTFMDRKTEIDRYMMSGPFSWPDIIDVINEHYIPVRHAPTKAQQQRYDLVPYTFVEPGFLILGGGVEAKDLAAATKVDRITTMHPEWFRGLLTQKVLQPIPRNKKSEVLTAAWQLYREGKFQASMDALSQSDDAGQAKLNSEKCERELLLGMAQFRTGHHDKAQKTWERASQAFPDEPLAWKCAAEAQMIGPFSRGFEVFTPLTEKALAAGTKSIGSQAPPETFTEPELWQRGIDFLLGMQANDGGFTDCDYDFGGTDSLPNVHVAVTSLAGMAMLRAAERGDISVEKKAKLAQAIDRAISFVTNESKINKFDRDEILWAYAYRLRFLARSLKQNTVNLATEKSTLEKALASATTALENVQSRQGGWYHEYHNPFVTATALSALHEAGEAGAKVDSAKIEQGTKSLLGDRFANGAYPYSSSRRPPNQPKIGTARDVAASAGRMPLCELGLWYWDKSNDEALVSAIDRSLAQQENLDVALKYDNHTSRLAYGGFFFWYDMRGRAEAIAAVADEKTKNEFKKQHRALIMALPELDGCFVDSHELGRVYGTAMALLSLANCQ